jgi:hypothetical protein
MTIFDRMLMAIKTLVVFALCSTAAWASLPTSDHGQGYSSGPPTLTATQAPLNATEGDDEGDDDGDDSGS